ncbi:MAG: substrate-binding domain-containing protein [Ruminococcus sp.]|jgi:putative molybdopterin biosynthesis protein
MEKMYTAQEVADYLKIKKTTVYELVKRGELASAKIGKQIRISQTQLDQYMNTFPSSGSQPLPLFPETDSSDSVLRMDYLSNASGLIIGGQEPSVVELLKNQMELTSHPVPLLHSYMNTYNSLYSLYFEKIHLALVTLSNAADSAGIRQRLTPLLPGIPVAILHIGQYSEGLLTSAGNPHRLRSLPDLIGTAVRIANREKGNSLRMMLDTFLSDACTNPSRIIGYEREHMSGMSAANAVASGAADVCLSSSLYTAFFPQLQFIPLGTASMDLVFHSRDLELPTFQAVIECVRSSAFQNSLQQFYHYQTERTGDLY